jgi:hypothetical protein
LPDLLNNVLKNRQLVGRGGERGLLAVQIRELRLERDDGMTIAGDFAGTYGADAHPPRRLDHGIGDSGMASHPEIVVRAPHHEVAGGTAAAPGDMGECSACAAEIGEHPLTAARDGLRRGMNENDRAVSSGLSSSSLEGLRILPGPRFCHPQCSTANSVTFVEPLCQFLHYRDCHGREFPHHAHKRLL